MDEVFTDCRSEEGVTIGLLDSIIFIARVLSKRDFESETIQSALRDFRNDEDVRKIMDSQFEFCKCGHDFETHKKPESDISWDVCSFPCVLCGCTEYEEQLDCGDHGCKYATSKKGIRTNGGCRCKPVFNQGS